MAQNMSLLHSLFRKRLFIKSRYYSFNNNRNELIGKDKVSEDNALVVYRLKNGRPDFSRMRKKYSNLLTECARDDNIDYMKNVMKNINESVGLNDVDYGKYLVSLIRLNESEDIKLLINQLKQESRWPLLNIRYFLPLFTYYFERREFQTVTSLMVEYATAGFILDTICWDGMIHSVIKHGNKALIYDVLEIMMEHVYELETLYFKKMLAEPIPFHICKDKFINDRNPCFSSFLLSLKLFVKPKSIYDLYIDTSLWGTCLSAFLLLDEILAKNLLDRISHSGWSVEVSSTMVFYLLLFFIILRKKI